MMLLKVFHFCLILISSQTLAEWQTERARYNNTFQNGVDCFSGPLFWTTCGYEKSRDITHGPASFPMVRPKGFLECHPMALSWSYLDTKPNKSWKRFVNIFFFDFFDFFHGNCNELSQQRLSQQRLASQAEPSQAKPSLLIYFLFVRKISWKIC